MTDPFELQREFEEEKDLFKIKQAHDLTLEMKNELAKYQKLVSLVEQDEINTMKNVLRGRWLYLIYPIENANKWLQKIKNNEKVDHRKKSDEESAFKYLTSKINELLDCNIEITDISFLGYGHEAYYVRFKIKEDDFSRDFELCIPDTEKLQKDNLDHLSYGKLRLSYQSSSCCWDSICMSYHTEDIKQKLKEWLTPIPV